MKFMVLKNNKPITRVYSDPNEAIEEVKKIVAEIKIKGKEN